MFPGFDLCCTDPTQHPLIITTGGELEDDLGEELEDDVGGELEDDVGWGARR